MKEGSSYVVACEMEGRERRGAVTGLLFYTLMRTCKKGRFHGSNIVSEIYSFSILFLPNKYGIKIYPEDSKIELCKTSL